MIELIDIKTNIIKYISNIFNLNNHTIINTIDTTSNLIINNTLEVGYTNDTKEVNTFNNASIKLLDRNDSIFKEIFVKDNDLYINPITYSNGNIEISNSVKLVRTDELNSILINEFDSIVFNNINIKDTGYIKFINDNSNITGEPNVGFRENNGIIEIKNNNDDWKQIITNNTFIGLDDVNIDINTLQNNDYLLIVDGKVINKQLDIINDSSPILGGDLYVNNSNIIVDTSTYLLTHNNEPVLNILEDTSISNNNYLSIRKGRNSNDEDIIELKANNSSESTANFKISTSGNGDLDIDLIDNNNNKGDFVIKANEFNLADIESFNMSTGKFIGSLNVVNINTNVAGLTEQEAKILNTNTETIVIQNNNIDNDYYVYIDSGQNGQKLNIIYESLYSNNNSKVIVLFKDNNNIKNIGTGTGLGNKLIFNSSGQSACLQYLNLYNIEPNLHRNRWQILNTGCLVD